MAENPVSSAKISVWWDIENCAVPYDLEPHIIARNVSSVLQQANLRGPISISAYGDTKLLTQSIQLALTSTGIHLHHIPSGRKDASDKAILVDMIFWALDNPPPAHILLISGDRDFANALHRLRMKTYNILLAHPLHVHVSPHLLEAASNVWYWTNLAKGEALTVADKQGSEPGSSSVGHSGIPSASCASSGIPPPGLQSEQVPHLSGEQTSINKQVSQKTSLITALPSLPNTSIPQDRFAFPSLPKSNDPPVIRKVPDPPNPVLPTYPSFQQHPQVRPLHLQELPRSSLPVFPQPSQQHADSFTSGVTQKKPDENSLQQKGRPAQRLSREYLSAEVRSSERPPPQNHHFMLSPQNMSPISTKGICRPPPPPRYGSLPHAHGPASGGIFGVGLHMRNGHMSNMQPDLPFRLNSAPVSMGPHTRNGNIPSLQPDLARFHRDNAILQLRKWLLINVLSKETGQSGYDISQVRKDFELATGVRLEPHQPLGYKGILDLFVENFSDIMIIKNPRKGLYLIYAKIGIHHTHLPTGSKKLDIVVDSLTKNGPAASVMVPSGNKGVSVSVPSGNERVSAKQLPQPVMTNEPSKAHALDNAPSQGKIPETCERSIHCEDIMKKLSFFLHEMVRKTGHGYDVSLIRKDFELAHGFSLNPKDLGFSGIRNLVEHFKDIVQIVTPCAGLCVLYLANQQLPYTTFKGEGPSDAVKSASLSPKIAATEYAKQLLGECRKLLCPLLQGKSEGYPQARLAEEFRKAFNCELDYKAAGYANLDDLLETLADVVQVKISVSGERRLHHIHTPSSPTDLVIFKAFRDEKGIQDEKQLADVKKASGRSKDLALTMLFPVGKKAPCADIAGHQGNNQILASTKVWRKISTTSSPGDTSSQSSASALSSRDNTATEFTRKVLIDCRVLLHDLFSSHPEGFPQVMLHEAFKNRHEYQLDHKAAGFSNLDDLVETLADVVEVQIAAEGQRVLHPKKPSLRSLEVVISGSVGNEGEKQSVTAMMPAVSEKEKKMRQKVNATLSSNKSVAGLWEVAPLPPAASIPISRKLGAEGYAAQLLTDCRNLLQLILPQHSGGYHLAKLPQDFERTYGYALDYKGAGYMKLNDLLETFLDFMRMETLPHCVLYLKTMPSSKKVAVAGVTKLPELWCIPKKDPRQVETVPLDCQGGLAMEDLATKDNDVKATTKSSIVATSTVSDVSLLIPAISRDSTQKVESATAESQIGDTHGCESQFSVLPKDSETNEKSSSLVQSLDAEYEARLSDLDDNIPELKGEPGLQSKEQWKVEANQFQERLARQDCVRPVIFSVS